MKLVKPTTVTDSTFTSSNVSENDYAEWNNSTAYVVGDKRIVIATHKIYEALTNNTNKYPPDYLSGTTPDWLEIGSTNAWKMFDQSYQSQTTNTGSITVVLEPGRINSLGLMNCDAANINIKLTVDAVDVYDNDLNVTIGNVNNWFEYFFNPIERKTDFVVTDIPVYGEGVLTVTLSSGVTDTVKCGLCIPGFFVNIGESLWGASIGILDYSKKEADIYGNYSVIERNYSSTLSDSILVENGRVGYIKKLLADYRTTPALWVASEEYEGLFTYGFYRDFSIVFESPAGSQCSIEIEGLT